MLDRSRLTQATSVPNGTVIEPGWKEKSFISTKPVEDCVFSSHTQSPIENINNIIANDILQFIQIISISFVKRYNQIMCSIVRSWDK